MSMESEMRAKFGGLWNSFLLLFVVIVCMRFSGLEQAGESLSEKILCGIHLFLGCIAAGILFGILRIFWVSQMTLIRVRLHRLISPKVLSMGL